MDKIDPALLENIVANYLWSNGKELFATNKKGRLFDFEIRGKDGKNIILEIKSSPPSESTLKYINEKLMKNTDVENKFILITPEQPSSNEIITFNRIFKNRSGNAQWVSLKHLPDIIGEPSPGPLDESGTWAKLQTNALIKGIDAYKSAPMGPGPGIDQKGISELSSLNRQFPYSLIATLGELPGSLESKLGLGDRRQNVTIVLSDIQNFSSLVTASRPDELKQAMGQYYNQARKAVFDYGGMLDKFIGDAVLAVFGYPIAKSSSTADAIRFGIDLISIGENVLNSWKAELNAEVMTGTRVGIATGDIWPINIGMSDIEITLLGDTINLAARLEKKCATDKILIDNRTYSSATRFDSVYIQSLNLQNIIISPTDAKGQLQSIRAWSQ